MKPLPYVLSKKAIADLNKIWQYTVDTWSVDQANRYYNLIFEEIDYLCKHPGSGRPMDHIRKGYRVAKVKSHLIFYKIANSSLEVIRILHGKMDIEQQFGG